MRTVEVVRAGPLTTIQDLGRPGLAHLGVPASGAVDRESLRVANRLVGNAENEAVLETTMLGCDLRPSDDRWIAVTGARGPVTVDGQPVSEWPHHLQPGSLLRIGPARWGVRAYVAISGGIAVPAVLGSRSADLLSGLGPPALSSGDLLPLGTVQGVPAPGLIVPDVPAGGVTVRLYRGPRDDWFSSPIGLEYAVGTDSNRVGVRLRGPALDRRIDGELPSEGMVLGAVQVPPSGQPVILLADHPTTGGYPVVGVVHPDDIRLVAQARPGVRLSFASA
jgi:biotin-dependent carboxylase-like uncharacterized protein